MDDSKVIVFIFISVVFKAALAGGGFSHIAINTTYVGVTMNSIACFQDLSDSIRDFENDVEMKKLLMHNNSKALTSKIRDRVNFQIELRISKEWSN